VDRLRQEGILPALSVSGGSGLRRPDLAGREVVVIDRTTPSGSRGAGPFPPGHHSVQPYSVIAGLGGQEVTYADIAQFVRQRKPGKSSGSGWRAMAMFEIRIHSGAGRGVSPAARLIALAAFYDGKQATATPFYGAERRGAPIVAFVGSATLPSRNLLAR